MSLEDAFQPAMDAHRAQVIGQTFGHLAPKPREIYKGYIVFACGSYGDMVPLDANFEDLPDSPWFYEDMQSFISRKASKRGVIYRFEGTYYKCKNGRARFTGKVRRMSISKLKVGRR